MVLVFAYIYIRVGAANAWGESLWLSLRQTFALASSSKLVANDAVIATVFWQAITKWVLITICGAVIGRVLQSSGPTQATSRTLFTAALSLLVLASAGASAFACIYFCNALWGGFNPALNLSQCLRLAFAQIMGKTSSELVSIAPTYQLVMFINSLFGLFITLIAVKAILVFRLPFKIRQASAADA